MIFGAETTAKNARVSHVFSNATRNKNTKHAQKWDRVEMVETALTKDNELTTNNKQGNVLLKGTATVVKLDAAHLLRLVSFALEDGDRNHGHGFACLSHCSLFLVYQRRFPGQGTTQEV